MFRKQDSTRNTCRTSGRSTKLVGNSILMPPFKRETRRRKNTDHTDTSRWCEFCENKNARVKYSRRDDAIVTLVKARGSLNRCTIEIEVAAKSLCVEEIFQSRQLAVGQEEPGQSIELQTSGILRDHTNEPRRPPSIRKCLPKRTRRRHKKRVTRKVCCALCGVIKYTPPVKRKLARRRVPKGSSVCVRERHNQASGDSENKPRKLVIWLRRYPRVKLCDIGRVFEVSRHFSCFLPPALFTFSQRSGVHCFKRQILALMCQELLGDGNVSTHSFCESQNAPTVIFSGSSPSFSPGRDRSELPTNWQNDNPETDTLQDDITRKRKRQVPDEFHITTVDKNNCVLLCEVGTCQRAQIFVRRNRYLCSRTYITWPFNRNDPPPCVMSPPRSTGMITSRSPRKSSLSPQESRQNGANIESMVEGDVIGELVVVPSLTEESEVKSSTAQCNQLTCVSGIFHQSYRDLTETSRVSNVLGKPLPTEQENWCVAHGKSWSIGGRLTVDSQSTTSSEEDLYTEECPRDKSENNELEDPDDTLDGSEVMCEMLDDLCSPSQTAAAATDSIVNEIQVHEQDAIVLDVIDDDPDLFGSMMTDTKDKPVQSMLLTDKRAPNFQNGTRTQSKLSDTDYRATDVKADSSPGEKTSDCTSTNQLTQRMPCFPASCWTQVGDMFILQEEGNDVDGNCEDWNSGRNTRRNLPPNLRQNTCNTDNVTHLKNGAISGSTSYGAYCRYYFSEKHFCLRKACTFLHVPRSGDEKYCMVMVQRFTACNNPVFVKRAVDVFTGYYEMCSPGLCFNVQVVTGLLASLIRLGFLSETFTALNLLLRHNIKPPLECVMGVFEHACNRKFYDVVPQLIFLSSKVVEAGCVFTLDQCERIQKCLECLNAAQTQMDVFLAVKCRALANICEGSSETLNMARAFVTLELCKKQEDWKQMAAVFLRVCASPCTSSHLLKFCMSVAMALLAEPTQSHTPPYSIFADAVASHMSEEGTERNLLGRIGISVLIRYYKTQQWNKGRKIVEILSLQQPCYSVLKGVFSNEDSTSRCCLITMATELHLHCGSVEGALNILRENNWFVSCNKWPCERGDVVHRVAVQTRLAQCASNRDALEVLTHLPGLQPPNDSAEVGEYTGLFNSLLRSCLERTALLVGADTLEFMLLNKLHAELLLVQNLIFDLGKRNRWNRARILFQRALEMGYYPLVDVVPGTLVVELPSSLNEVEMAICLEMLICRNIPYTPEIPTVSHAPVVTLKRASNNGTVPESEYLSAGCRLLSSAQLPNPKLRLSYTTVNSQQEQVYTIEPRSAYNWLHYNHSWALKLWSV